MRHCTSRLQAAPTERFWVSQSPPVSQNGDYWANAREFAQFSRFRYVHDSRLSVCLILGAVT